MTRRRLPIAAGLALASMLAVMLPSQASAASSPVVRLANPCPVAINPSNDAAPELRAFCQEADRIRPGANRGFEKHYKAATRRRILRLVRSEARRAFPDTNVRSQAAESVVFVNTFYFVNASFLQRIKGFARKALPVLKKVVGGVVRLVPQARIINCGLLGVWATAAPLIAGKDLKETATTALLGCLGAFIRLKKVE
jgi:hypothetical protein